MEAAYSSHLRRYFKTVREKALQEAFKEAIRAVLADPGAGDAKRGDLTGISTARFSYRGTQYRLAYRFDAEHQAVVFLFAGTRENFYDELKRYLDETAE